METAIKILFFTSILTLISTVAFWCVVSRLKSKIESADAFARDAYDRLSFLESQIGEVIPKGTEVTYISKQGQSFKGVVVDVFIIHCPSPEILYNIDGDGDAFPAYRVNKKQIFVSK